ncbi:MAG: hypothetical protein BSOLF_0048 [Candidatus Carbobacillus altaicus]|uniref:Calcineurin-like phosphoesterase domain-containing protein n=1 Tax=Candidatus Carbonibacillus altaicus TaxID=2163959 RepID=A0A2R6XXN7_9BACL|nr:MAG: hypothetical protein BSOLF_0048 [Candidatus Carbobacillus altaicus]
MRIAVLGDFHFSRLVDAEDEARRARDLAAKKVFDAFFSEDADLYVSVGDLTHMGHPDEYRAVYALINQYGKPFYHALGNHDAYSLTKEEILSLTGQKRYDLIETPRARLVFLDTAREMNLPDWSGSLDDMQREWLKDVLHAEDDRPVIIFAHHPIYNTTARSAFDKLSIVPEEKVEELLLAAPTSGIYVCGHNHINSIVTRDRWCFVQTAATWDIPAYRLLTVQDHNVSIELITIDDPELGELIRRFHLQMEGFTPIPQMIAQGDDDALSHTFVFPRLGTEMNTQA